MRMSGSAEAGHHGGGPVRETADAAIAAVIAQAHEHHLNGTCNEQHGNER